MFSKDKTGRENHSDEVLLVSILKKGYNTFKVEVKVVVYMSILQEQAVRMISDLSDENVSFLIEIIQRLMPSKTDVKETQVLVDDEGMQAFHRLEAARDEVIKYLPEDFDPDKELEEARAERYGCVG